MIDTLLRWSLELTRWWVRCYTTGLAPDIAASRRAEIESDMWEMQHDADLAPPVKLLTTAMWRLLRGISADLGWRMDHAGVEEQLLTRRLIALSAATTIVLMLWALPPLLFKGRRELVSCAATSATPANTAALRHDIIRCAGAFFSARN